jgi:hypothetical protein
VVELLYSRRAIMNLKMISTASLWSLQASSVSAGAGSYIMTVDGHAEMLWEAELTEGRNSVVSPPFLFEGWPFNLEIERYRGEPSYWGVFCGSRALKEGVPVPSSWKVERVGAFYTLSCPDHGWSANCDSTSSQEKNMVTDNWGRAKAVKVEEGVTKLKVQVVMTKLVAELTPIGKGG